MLKKLLSILALFIIATTVALAFKPEGIITGQVLDSSNGYYLPGAVVKVKGTKLGAVTDKSGNFQILNVPIGTHTITVSYLGYSNKVEEIEITDKKTSSLKFLLVSGTINADEVLVLGDGLKGQAKALNTQKNNNNITNIISADQVGRFPDANVGDALKRVPGITVQNDQGEARFGLIRGTAARLNSVTINGNRIPSAEAENREVQLDLVSADMVQSIEVSKALTPNMDADAIGGSINLVTRNAPSERRLSVTAGSGYNALSEKPILNGALIYGERLLDDKLGFVVSGSYNNHKLGSDNVEVEWAFDDNNTSFMEDFQIRQYEVQRVRSSISLDLDYKFDENNTINLGGIFNNRDDWENRYRTRFKFDNQENGAYPTEIIRQTKGGIGGGNTDYSRLEEQQTMNIAISGQHLLFNSLKMNWNSNYAKASEDRPNERYIDVAYDGASVIQNLSNLEKPNISYDNADNAFAKYEFDKIEELNQYTEDVDFNGKIDFELPLEWYNSKVKFGGRFRMKTKLRDNDFFEYKPTDSYEAQFLQEMYSASSNKSKDNFLPGDYVAGDFVSREFLGNLDFTDESKFEKKDIKEEYVPANFDAKENIFGGYIMAEHDFTDKLHILYGVRLESTDLTYNANKFEVNEDEGTTTITPTTGTDSYVNILPSLHVKYALTESDLLRAAWTNSLSRPNYYDIAPYRQIIIDGGDRELKEGNPSLKPTNAMNFDLMYEHYYESVGILSLGAFYKDLTDFTYTFNTRDYVEPGTGDVYDDYSTPRNGASAKIMGAEIAFQRRLDFLPSFLEYLNIYTNYTYTNSSVSGLGIDGRDETDLSLPGTAENTFNVSLSWENKDLTLRISGNYASSYIDQLESEARNDRYYDEQFFLDINGSYKFTDQFSFFFEVNNLTNQPLRYFQGVSSRVMQLEYYNTRATAGIKFNL
ncbi:MAG: TonB-dependent receptor [Candidatus Kapaibacterium sp.]